MKHLHWRLATYAFVLAMLVIAATNPFNTPPIFLAPTETSLQAYTERSFIQEVRVEDLDGDIVEVKAYNLPDWLEFDPVLGEIKGQPKPRGQRRVLLHPQGR
jgi:hypothetical protein